MDKQDIIDLVIYRKREEERSKQLINEAKESKIQFEKDLRAHREKQIVVDDIFKYYNLNEEESLIMKIRDLEEGIDTTALRHYQQACFNTGMKMVQDKNGCFYFKYKNK